ncbi:MULTISPECIES: TssN family type VI secretion system protein [Tenacibaculum]|uniref:TssN family type VI secretion system protein n=2 Tax=Tenacibaculum discolor TaxID=361581 RepID=A0ABT9F784_9FLAO|nr:TssN family type VI secretion system protein [Tenacibaculum discolor]MDP2542580.1 TssN family type VI secretion system protein [Tenacibaculum discolor]PHO00292.1 hypothetical protein CSC82_29640 [Rhodobacteraceae bacterium 4F10]RLJ98645.1 hypothetical protein C8N27_2548 [Tenacibaculum discolor]
MNIIIVYFLKFLLAPLIAIISLMVLNNIVKAKKSFNIKKAIVLVLLLTLILIAPVFISLLKYEFVWLGLILTVLCYLFVGVFFMLFQNTKFYKSIGLDNKFHTLFFAFIVMVLSAWLYYLIFEKISNLPYALWAMLSIIWFVLPLLYTMSLGYFLNISKPFYKAWNVSDNGATDMYWDNVDVFKLIQVTVKIKRNPDDKNYSSFSVKLPMEVSVGMWFNRFIEDQNFRFPDRMIDTYLDGEPIGWIFYTNKWFNFPLFTKVLDAEKDGKFNRIRNKQTIYIRRTALNTIDDE